MDATKLLEALKSDWKVWLGVALASGSAVFMPTEWLALLGLTKLVEQYRGWIGGSFLLSGGLLVGNLVDRIARRVTAWTANRRRLGQLHANLESLTFPEKQILAGYVVHETPTQYFRKLPRPGYAAKSDAGRI